MLVMNREELYKIAEDAVCEEELTTKDIPCIDLYVDQILNLVSDKNAQGSERYRDKQLTKTMINNYSKDGLITPIKGKKYSREQIVQILTVYTLKNTLSIGEIKRLLDGEYAVEGYSPDHLLDSYDRYIDIKRDNRDFSQEILGELLDKYELDITDEKDFMLIVGSLLSLSGSLRSIAQALIDEKYPIPDEAEEKQRAKEAKKEKSKEKGESKEKKKKKEDE